MDNRVIFVCIEYSPKQNRVMVRGTFDERDLIPKPLAPENIQNVLGTFLNMEMSSPAGFSFLEGEDGK